MRTMRTGGVSLLVDKFLFEFVDGNVGGGNAPGARESAQRGATSQHRHVEAERDGGFKRGRLGLRVRNKGSHGVVLDL